MKSLLISLILLNFSLWSEAQKPYVLDASAVNTEVKTGLLNMGNPGPSDKEILINNRYMTLAGKPIIPVMGEVHYTRIPKSQWEDVILKMKACGINIVAAYVLWIHHEEIEGQFDWSDNKDFRAFVKLCAKHDMWVYPRIGPWCHAEVRNGGTPDWILLKTNLKDRSNDPVYQSYADEWYKQIALQLKGMLYKDGGPVVGIQLENEYGRGKGGEEHILWLKKTAQKYGLDVPMYTVTGWGNGSVPPLEVIPLWGAYPDEPWADNLNRSSVCDNFQFNAFREDDKIGNDLKKSEKKYLDLSAYPYFTCEVGVGIENTEHRRLIIDSKDGLGLIMAKIGSGSNLPGYYMFAGGSNPHGILTSMEENKDETGYWNTNPVISYDFQAAIRESGELNGSYFEVKTLHYFLNEFGDMLAPMEPVFPLKKEDLQYVVRTDNNSAFLFGINYCRHNISGEKKDVQFSIKLKNETLTFPSQPIIVADSATFIWPINFRMGNTLLKYATAQPLCNLADKWIFIQDAAVSPEFCFDASTINKITSSTGKISQSNGKYLISGLQPGLKCIINIQDKNNSVQTIVVLSKQEAKQAWFFKTMEKKYFFVSDANMYLNGNQVHAFSKSNNITINQLNVGQLAEDVFTTSTYSVPEKKFEIKLKEPKPLDNAQWLKTSAVEKLDNSNILRHRFFLKEFSLGNPSKIKKAELILAAQSVCRVQVNSVWVNQNVASETMNILDVTGYVQKGENRLMLDFPFEAGQKAFAAKLVVEYFNADQIEITSDQSWLMKDDYTYPSYLIKDKGFKQAEAMNPSELLNTPMKDHVSYSLILPDNYLVTLNNMYLNVSYSGDKARLYMNHYLIADDFNSGADWNIGLNRLGTSLENQSLKLEIYPLENQSRVYFDDEKAKQEGTVAKVKKIQLIPEYQFDFDVSGEILNFMNK
ncbi:MAG TPA: beta-galactosidase [Prolixibacteraceae bacterium]|nr:beta-galactosidase [Prolixibacteraceae bacterium]